MTSPLPTQTIASPAERLPLGRPRTKLGPLLVRLGLFLGVCLVPLATTSVAQTPPAIKMEIGFAGHAKLGCWLPFQIRTPDRLEPVSFMMTVRDGNDTPVTYSGKLRSIGTGLNQHQGWLRLGRAKGPAHLKLLDVNDLVVFEADLPLRGTEHQGVIHESTRAMILIIEPSNQLAQTIASTTLLSKRDTSPVVVSINRVDLLPQDSFGYDAIDTIILTTSDLERLETVHQRQWNAILAWVKNGGRLIVSAGKNGKALFTDADRLQPFSPGNYLGPTEMTRSKQLEAFANNGQLITRQGAPIPLSRFESGDGKIVVEQDGVPLIIRQARGFGQITLVTFDLDSSRIQNWPGFPHLLQRLMHHRREDATTPVARPLGKSVSYYGYKDLIGQLRVPLEHFSNVRFVPFTWIAILIAAYILLVGPGDYFFLNRIVKRMELTWLTFPLVTLLFCGAAVAIYRATRPRQLQVNQFEIIDIDAVTQHVRGTTWSNVYSPTAATHDLEQDPQCTLGFEITSSLITWHGLPGDGLGGMNTPPNRTMAKPGYRLDIIDRQPIGTYDSRLVQMPFYASSTQPLFTLWNATYPKKITSHLAFDSATRQLKGTVTNPLDVRLTHVWLLFDDYAYVLDNPELEPGETIDVLSEMREKTIRSLLTRRTKVANEDDKSRNVPWNPTEKRMSRIADMLMFHQLAGGTTYTGLTHNYQGFIDMSDLIGLQRAVLVGRIESIGSRLMIDAHPLKESYDQTSTLVRIVLPVQHDEGKQP